MKVPGNVLADYPDLFALILVLLLTGELVVPNLGSGIVHQIIYVCYTVLRF